MTDDGMKEARALIQQKLQDNRPDRYTVGGIREDGTSESQWLADIAEEIEPLLPEAAARKLLARTLVNQQEGNATRRANQFLREYGRTGDVPMFWAEDGAWPISVMSRDPNNPAKMIEERVALRAVTIDDARAFAHEERRRAAADFASRNASCVGAEDCADKAEMAGFNLIWDWLGTLDTDS